MTEAHTPVSTSSPADGERVAYRRFWWVGPLAVAVVAVANLLIYGVAAALFPGPRAWPMLGVGPVIASSVAYLVGAVLVFAAVGRLARRPLTAYRIIAAVALLLSLGAPLSAGAGAVPGAPPADAPTVLTLALMHVVSAVIAVGLLTTLARAAGRP